MDKLGAGFPKKGKTMWAPKTGDSAGDSGAMLTLPYPVSTNRYWRRVGHRLIVSDEAQAYKRMVALAARYAGLERPITGAVELCIAFHPKTAGKPAKGSAGSGGGRGTLRASKTRLDLDNVLKVVIDSLNGIAFADDKQVHRLSAEISYPIDHGGLRVWIAPLHGGSILPLSEAGESGAA